MKTTEFLYDGFILRVSYTHTEAEPETGTSEHVEVEKVDIIQDVDDCADAYHSINLTPFIYEYCHKVIAELEDRIKNNSQRDFRTKNLKK